MGQFTWVLASDARARGWYSVLYCTVLTLMRRMSSNIDSNTAAGSLPTLAATSCVRQTEALSLPKHAAILLLNESTSREVKTTERIQYMVDKANAEMVNARSHFLDRLWSPLVLKIP